MRLMIVILAIAAFGAEARAQQSEAQQCGSADLTAEQRMHICSAETEATQDLVVMPPSPLAPKAALFNQGAAQLKLKDYGHAIASFSEAIKLDPRHAAALNGRGFAYEATGQHDRAITDYSLAIAIDPLLVEALLNRGAAYRNKGRHDAALQDFDRALTLNPKSTAALFGRALVYQDKSVWEFDAYQNEGRYENLAIRDYSEVIRLEPGKAHAFNNRALLLAKQRQYDRALQDCNEALRLDPNNALYFKNRGNLHRLVGQYARAVADYRKALSLRPDEETRKQLASSLKELGLSS